MNFTYNKFLRPLTESDTSIQILDDSGSIVYTINPFAISSPIISNNLIKINFKNGKIIIINFSSTNEAKLAISRLQAQIDELLTRTPLVIDRQVKNYVDDKISSSGYIGLENGVAIVRAGDTNVSKEWSFGTAGNGSILFPDGTTQSTAWSGGRVVFNPTASIGLSGDKLGDMSFSATYLYYCTQDYDGVTNVWKRISWSGDTW